VWGYNIYSYYTFSSESSGSPVGLATDYGMDDQRVGVRAPVETRTFTFLYLCLYGDQTVSYTMRIGESFAGGKAAGERSWPLSTSAEFKKSWIYTSTLQYVFMA
jgi:hypothetical protein